jgi:electron transfer flavoprotein beta subunit
LEGNSATLYQGVGGAPVKGLNIIVCVKQVPNPEAPPSVVEIDSERLQVRVRGLPPEINPLCGTALEAALRLREVHGGKVTALSVGDRLSEHVLRKVLAAGADELIVVQGEGLNDLDSYSTALILYKAVEKIGEYDLILTGKQSADWNSGQTGLILAELLKIPAVNSVKKVEVVGREVLLTTVRTGGYDVIKAPLPLLATVSSELGELRYVSVTALKKAREKPIKIWRIEDLGLDASMLKKRKVVELLKPKLERVCTFVEGRAPEEKGKNLAIKLLDALQTFITLKH